MTTTTQTTVDTGRTGAKRQSWKPNPRSILIKLIAENPHETMQDEEAILELLWEAVKGDEEQLRSICDYWGTNNYRSIVYKADPQKRLARREAIEREKKSIASRIILMDWQTPSGKLLRDCTKQDCKRVGGWLVRVADKMKPRQTVGQAFSEKQLKALLIGK